MGRAGSGRNFLGGLVSGPRVYDVEEEEFEPNEDQDTRLELDSAGETGECSESAWQRVSAGGNGPERACGSPMVSSSSKSCMRSSRSRSESSEKTETVLHIECARGLW